MPLFVSGKDSAHQMPQLDSLRAFAVLAVLCVHFVNRPPRWLTAAPWGVFGVELFFVLSGFLITGILLDCRGPEAGEPGRFRILRQFYIRRFLRIFPLYLLYYAVVLVGYFIRLEGFQETFGWIDRVPHYVPHAAIMLVTTLWLSAISRHLYENPINRAKRWFPYRVQPDDSQSGHVTLPGASRQQILW